ncbi:MAG TPA: tryptophan synthase subunit alpha, partial [Gaiellales bacterium]|nr:tryptophan synthase subunit alpha [Gaiellales bacterium]
SADDRIDVACARAGGFIYLVSVAGTTGARAQASDRVAGLIARVRPHTPLPLLVGFGISTAEHLRAMLDAGADGVVIGSRAIEVAEEGGPAALEAFVADVASALPVSN